MHTNKKNWIARTSFIIFIITMVTSVLSCTILNQYRVINHNKLYSQTVSFNFEIRTAQKDSKSISAVPFTPDAVNLFDYREQVDLSPSPGITGKFLISIYNKSNLNPQVQINFEETKPSSLPIIYAYEGRFYSNTETKELYLRSQNNHVIPITLSGNLNKLEELLGNQITSYFASDGNKRKTSLNIKWFWAVDKNSIYQTTATNGETPELHYLETNNEGSFEETSAVTFNASLFVSPLE